MNVLYTPQVNDEQTIDYKFNGDIIQVKVDDKVKWIDLGNVTGDKIYVPKFPIRDVFVENGQVHVELLNYIPFEDENGNEYVDECVYEWHVPENEEFEIGEVERLEVEVVDESPTALESVERRVVELEEIIDILLNGVKNNE